ncbi:MAG: alpha/beta fold hydrolase [Longimicrobiales bacterium]
MSTIRLTFPGAEGHELAARLELPADGEPAAFAVFAHCFTCSKNLKAAVNLTRALAERGLGVLRFDFTGLGESEGDFRDTNFSSNVADLVAAARFLEERYEAPQLFVGHSLGGAAVLLAAAEVASVRAVATLGAPADPAHVLHHVAEDADAIRQRGQATVSIGGRPFQVKAQFLEDLEGQHMREVVSSLGRAVLVLHSPTDTVVGIENAAKVFEMARHPRSFISLDGADHLLTDPGDSEWIGGVLAAWAARYVDGRPADGDAEALVEGQRVVARTGPEGFRTDIQVRRHHLVADEPESVGGEDAGPTPYDLLVAGLGACTSMTLQMYARRKEWPLDEVRVRLRHRRLHGKDTDDPDGEGDHRLDVMDRTVELTGPLDPEQRARLLEIADRCPVHRTLEAGVQVRTTLLDESPP